VKTPTASSGQSTSQLDGEIYIADGDYIKDVEVNDLRNRYTLTKGSTQKMVKYPCNVHDILVLDQVLPTSFVDLLATNLIATCSGI
jgi:hypothetical protein